MYRIGIMNDLDRFALTYRFSVLPDDRRMLAMAQKIAIHCVLKYGDDSPDTIARLKAGGTLPNDHVAVQSAYMTLRFIEQANKL